MTHLDRTLTIDVLSEQDSFNDVVKSLDNPIQKLNRLRGLSKIAVEHDDFGSVQRLNQSTEGMLPRNRPA
jgi:hypothetical protein